MRRVFFNIFQKIESYLQVYKKKQKVMKIIFLVKVPRNWPIGFVSEVIFSVIWSFIQKKS